MYKTSLHSIYTSVSYIIHIEIHKRYLKLFMTRKLLSVDIAVVVLPYSVSNANFNVT